MSPSGGADSDKNVGGGAGSATGGNYSPAREPRPTKMTIEDVREMGTFFKELIESSHLKWWIIAAGIGGLAETLHVCWLIYLHVR
jgi:hypothetical protein